MAGLSDIENVIDQSLIEVSKNSEKKELEKELKEEVEEVVDDEMEDDEPDNKPDNESDDESDDEWSLQSLQPPQPPQPPQSPQLSFSRKKIKLQKFLKLLNFYVGLHLTQNTQKYVTVMNFNVLTEELKHK